MGAMIPIDYYQDPDNHSSYKYVNLLDLVNNFIENMTGDDTLVGQITRRKVVYHAKQAIKEFNIGSVNEPKGCEIELNDTLTAIYPYDYVNYCSVSFVNKTTGELMTMTLNPKVNAFTSWLQDQDANFLFDQDGYVLEGTSMNAQLETQQSVASYQLSTDCQKGFYDNSQSRFSTDVAVNPNGYFNLTKDGIHFNSDALSKVIMLTYMSDGLEYADDKDIQINKILENAVYAYIRWQILSNKSKAQEYVVRRAEKDFFALKRNATIKLMNVRYEDVILLLNKRKNWFK